MATRMQQRRGTAAQWTSANPILAAGEIGFETDTGKFKMGNGSSAWSALSYFADSSDFDTTAIESTIDSKVATAVNNLVAGAPAALDTLNEIADAIDNNSTFAATIIGSINAKANGTDLTAHTTSTINVHGIANTSELATGTDVSTAQTAAQQYADGAVNTHNGVTTSVHGISNTANLVYQVGLTDAISTHSSDTTGVHGITDTSALATHTDIETHRTDTTNVHGIEDTANIVMQADLTAHNNDTTNVHGIANTASLATTTYADDAVSAHNLLTENVHGITDTGDLVLTNDSRLSDTRTPTDDTVSTAKIVDGAVTSAKIADGTIVNDDINASAAIGWTKLAVSSTVSETELGYVDGVTSSIQTQLDAKLASASAASTYAPLASPALTGTPTAPTANAGTNTTQVATTAFVTGAVNDLIAAAPGALNTLDELAAALGDDANFATTVTNNLALKAPLASPTFTGTVTVAASGIAFTDGTQTKEGVPSRTAIIQKSAAYTLSALTERDSMIEVSHTGGSAVDITIPANSSVAYPVGTSIDVLRTNTGGVRIVGAAGVTVNATPGAYLRAQWSAATLFKRATDTWVLIGDLATA
jgi:hypothetical protein